MTESSPRTILVTGATSGFGEAIAKCFARQGHRLIICGRRLERLQNLAAALQTEFGAECMPLTFDVRSKEEVRKAIGSLQGEWRQIDMLVNNAGLASGLSDIQDGDFEDWDAMIDTNVKGLLYVTRECVPLLTAQHNRRPHIFNIGSIAGKYVYPKGNVYCGTKHAVRAISESMRMDMLPLGIKVTNIQPGMAETEFSIVRFHGDAERAAGVYAGMEPLRGEDIADAVSYCAGLPDHVCIDELTITPTAQAGPRDVIRR